jgi:hypothetical protein
MAIIFNSLAGIFILPITIKMGWIFSLLLIAVGIYKVCTNLNIIQEVSLSSDKYQQERMYEAITKAFETQVKSNQPTLQLIFKSLVPPFKFSKSQEIPLEFKIRLENGKIAKNSLVLLVISKEFDFVNIKKKWNQSADRKIPNGLSTKFILGDVRRGISKSCTLIIKTPSIPGEYQLSYTLSSEEFTKFEYYKIEIV